MAKRFRSITFHVPEDYEIPDNLVNLNPDINRLIIDCMAGVLEVLNVNLADNTTIIASLSQKHDRQMRDLVDQYASRLELQKKQLLEERNEVIDDIIKQDRQVIEKEKRRVSELEREIEQVEKNTIARETERASKETLLHHQFYETSLRDKDRTLQQVIQKIESLNDTIVSLKSSNCQKGKFGENCVRSILQDYFPRAEISDVSNIAHAGDLLFSQNGSIVMIETKLKMGTTKEDIVKFEKDVHNRRSEYNAALFLTSSAGIPTKGEFAIELVSGIPVVYATKVLETPYIVNVAMRALLSLVNLIPNDSCDNGTTDEKDADIDRLLSSLSSIITQTYTICDVIKSTNKTFGIIAQQANDQKKINTDRLIACAAEIQAVIDMHRNKLNLTRSHASIPTTPLATVPISKKRKSTTTVASVN